MSDASPARAESVSLEVSNIEMKTVATITTKGKPKPTRRALRAEPSDTDTVTCSPLVKEEAADVTTSIVFTLLSEALQWDATLQAAQADDCTIRTLTSGSLTLSTTPECVILLFIKCKGTTTFPIIKQKPAFF